MKEKRKKRNPKIELLKILTTVSDLSLNPTTNHVQTNWNNKTICLVYEKVNDNRRKKYLQPKLFIFNYFFFDI